MSARPPVWLPYLRRPSPVTRLRLFCFPYAGGGALAYRPWLQALPPQVEVCPVELPGRGVRLAEPLVDRCAPLADAVVQGLLPHLDRPFAIFGHSMGALLGFETARRLRDGHGRAPRALFLSGRRAPQVPDEDPTTHLLADAALVERLRGLNGTPPAVLEHPELLALVLPVLRADFAVSETHTHAPGEPFDVPLLVFGGETDPEVDHSGLEAWREHTRGPFRVHRFQGDHFFLHSAQAALLEALAAELRLVLASLPEHNASARGA